MNALYFEFIWHKLSVFLVLINTVTINEIYEIEIKYINCYPGARVDVSKVTKTSARKVSKKTDLT